MVKIKLDIKNQFLRLPGSGLVIVVTGLKQGELPAFQCFQNYNLVCMSNLFIFLSHKQGLLFSELHD